MEIPQVHAKVLRRAVELLGGEQQLQAQLCVPQSVLQRWLKSESAMPTGIFLEAVDLILEMELPSPRSLNEIRSTQNQLARSR